MKQHSEVFNAKTFVGPDVQPANDNGEGSSTSAHVHHIHHVHDNGEGSSSRVHDNGEGPSSYTRDNGEASSSHVAANEYTSEYAEALVQAHAQTHVQDDEDHDYNEYEDGDRSEDDGSEEFYDADDANRPQQ